MLSKYFDIFWPVSQGFRETRLSHPWVLVTKCVIFWNPFYDFWSLQFHSTWSFQETILSHGNKWPSSYFYAIPLSSIFSPQSFFLSLPKSQIFLTVTLLPLPLFYSFECCRAYPLMKLEKNTLVLCAASGCKSFAFSFHCLSLTV